MSSHVDERQVSGCESAPGRLHEHGMQAVSRNTGGNSSSTYLVEVWASPLSTAATPAHASSPAFSTATICKMQANCVYDTRICVKSLRLALPVVKAVAPWGTSVREPQRHSQVHRQSGRMYRASATGKHACDNAVRARSAMRDGNYGISHAPMRPSRLAFRGCPSGPMIMPAGIGGGLC